MTVRSFHKSFIYSKPSEKIVAPEMPLDGRHAYFRYTTQVFNKYGPKVPPPPPKKYKWFSLPKKEKKFDAFTALGGQVEK